MLTAPPTTRPLQFASDNYSGICPEALDYLLKANQGDVPAYGDDEWTQKASDAFRDIFEIDCEVFFVFNGTAANSLTLASLCQSYHSVICHELAHVETDECGAPEFASNGSKLLLAQGDNGKLDPADVERLITKRTDIHYPKPKVISLTQATEVGTLYTTDELAALSSLARHHGLKVHMDGARFANALAASGKTPAELTWQAGVDVLCCCGTKNGMGIGEAILFFDKALAEDFAYRCKQAGQLCSKMRFISAPWLGLLETGAWLRNADHANRMAAYLEQQLRQIPELTLLFPRQANGVFVQMPQPLIDELYRRGWKFYTFIGTDGARLMCGWNTTTEAIDELATDIQDAVRLLR
ncbi:MULTISPECIES: low specificity L-threonine aldolase [Cyanophyceae]|uniref:threonine aldolase family protein n=1 Tax=Cyanophyceae TaxID=3028117 RepID=UPI001686A64A|nr:MULTISPECIES: low specificity L-threonine aldolase [Cyanophyceae]MBD1915663.1 low specificity L-threonine aldolase [Phormidium sp. FACHB-77]MBD2029297.1 low specificity L-threonine aldolase [Phormidium sp. FACHB-322]MBD2049287.1 low specificity L-threonine aldolase [Leptolyngbya sp. FACHB-60]